MWQNIISRIRQEESDLLYSFNNFEAPSPIFWLGIIAGILLALILFRLRKFIPQTIRSIRRRFSTVKQNFSTGTEVRLLNDIYHFAQKQHIAASLFSLDEITIEPKVLVPLIQVPKSIDLAPTDSVSLTIPYIPDWPEFAAIYKASTMTLIDALQGDANIILAGHPGSGKTVALAWLASCITRNDKGLGKLANLFPIYIHATDIPHLFDQSENGLNEPNAEISDSSGLDEKQTNSKIKNPDEVIDLFVQAISRYVSPINITKLPNVVRLALENQQAILILDRLDEFPPLQARMVTEYIKILNENYPKLRIVVAMSYDDLAGLPNYGFNLLAMAAWTEEDRLTFLRRWGQEWKKWVIPSQKSNANRINLYYLKSWLGVDNTLLKPLEYTLKVWASFSGDILGTDGPSAIESYIRRMTYNVIDAHTGLEGFALRLLYKMKIVANPNDSERVTIQFKQEVAANVYNDTAVETNSPPSISNKQLSFKEVHGVDQLINNGILQSFPGSNCGFSHPVIFGYLAGKALLDSSIIDQLAKQPSWSGRNLSLYYLARFGDVTNLIQNFLQDDDSLHTNHLLISRWLQVAPKNRAWRTIILRTLTSILQKERETLSLSAKIIAAMAFSGDIGVSLYFRQLLKSEHSNLIQLASLGCGILADKKAIEELIRLLQEQSPTTVRSACLALAAIGDKQSLEILASSLLNGSEELRRYAAEALANNPKEGQPALKEGSGMDDLLVRRSVVFGLIRVNQPWATKIVENLQLEDNEWVVRNAAIQAFDEQQRKASYAPTQLLDLTETRWLIDYADKLGTTVAPGKPAEQLVAKALINGNPDEKLYALDYFRMKCYPSTMEMIYSVYSHSTSDIRDLAYYTLWLMALAGIKLPISFD
jgi:hypothetical protein